MVFNVSSSASIPLAFCLCFVPTLVWADRDTQNNLRIEKIELGLQGKWKVGYPTQTRITISSGTSFVDGSIVFETVDADGVGVNYSHHFHCEPESTHTISMITQHGRLNRPMRVIIRDERGEIACERELSTSERGESLPVGQPWIVGFGKELYLDQASMQSAKGGLPSYSTSELRSTEQIPVSSLGYRGIDVVVVSTQDLVLLDTVSTEQQRAFMNWVKLGGEVLVWVGKNGDAVSRMPWLMTLLNADYKGLVEAVEPGIFESYLASQKKLGSLACSEFAVRDSNIEVALSARDRRRLPFLFNHAFGLGRVQVLATDLDTTPIMGWPDRSLAMNRLLAFHDIDVAGEASKANRRTSTMGYEDLAGQAKTTLENFRSVRSGSLSLLSTIVVVIMFMVGAFDYFVIAKRWRRPTWTWWSLPLWSSIAIGGIVLLSQYSKPDRSIINSLELVDIDVASRTARGKAWLHQYEGRSGTIDVAAKARRLTPKAVTKKSTPEQSSTRVSWSGHPGRTLGGFESTVRTDFGFPRYQVESDKNRLVGVGISTAGTKGFALDWADEIEAMEFSPFVASGSFDLLEGSWTNPMQETLLDGFLIYRKWFYRLPTKLRPGVTFQVTAKDIPKDLVRYLQRRQIVKDTDVGVAWDTDQRDDPYRLMEMMMFHNAAGGTDYTGLSHRFLDDIDLSSLLKAKRIMIVGRLEHPIVEWSATRHGTPLAVEADQRQAFVRFLIPIADKK